MSNGAISRSSASIIAIAIVAYSRAVSGSGLSGEPFAPVTDHQRAPVWAPVVVEHSLDSLLPLATLVRERMPTADSCAEIEDVLGRDPRLREPANHQQLTQMPRVRTPGLRTLLAALPGAGLRRLSQMHLRADPAEPLDHEPPPGRRFQRHLELLAGKAREEPPAVRH